MIQCHLIPVPAAWFFRRSTSAALVGLCASLLGCAGESVNMGQNEAEPSPLPSSSRCLDSTTLEGDVVVRTQDEVDSLEGCQVIDGDLHIVAFEGADLRALHALTTVGEELNIGSTEFSEQPASPPGEWDGVQAAARQRLEERWLESLHGLESLESVGALLLTGYAGRDVDPLSNLQIVTSGRLTIQNDRELEGLEGLRNVKNITNLEVTGCPALYGIEALTLPELMTGLTLEFSGLSRLGQLDVRTITGRLSIDHTELRNLDELSSLTWVGLLAVEANFSLENIDGVNGLESAEMIDIDLNTKLTHLPDFSNLQWLDYFRVVNHPRLTTLPTFPMLNLGWRNIEDLRPATPEESVVRQPDLFQVSYNDQITAVTVPAGWLSGGAVLINDNPALTRVDFTEQTSIEYLSIQNNPALGAVGLGALDTVNRIDVIDNPNLQLSVFEPVRTFQTTASGNAAEP